MKALCIKGVKEGDQCSTDDKTAPKEVEIYEGEIYDITGGYKLPDGEEAVFLKERPSNVAYALHSFEILPDDTAKPDVDNLPLLSINEVLRFMVESGAYMPYNRPTTEMLRSIAKSKLKIY